MNNSIKTIPFPICLDCADKIGGAASGPDAPWRLAHAGESCEAADCSASEANIKINDFVHFPVDHKDLNNELSPFAGLSGRVVENWGQTQSGLDLLVRLENCTHDELVQRYVARSIFVTIEEIHEWHSIDDYGLSDTLPDSTVVVEADGATLTR